MAPSQPDAATRARLKEIKLEDVDFEAVKSCEDKHVLKRYIQLIEDDGSYYLDLLKACKDKLLQVSPKEYYLLYPVSASEQEIDEATQDLLDWEAAVKETDKALLSAKKDRIFDDVPKGAAPVRGQEPAVARANLQQQAPSRPAPKTKSDSYARDKTSMKDYYSAWDKVDVDAIEEEMEQEEKEQEESRLRHFEDLKTQQEDAQMTSEINCEVERQDVPQAHWRHMADSEKEKGNEAFYSKDYEEAEAYYSRSIQFVPDDPSTWANRALVRLKLDRPSAALEDCEHSLALNPRYMKALHRKGKALHELKRHEEAVRCFQLALAESPGNTQINGDLMVARRYLRTGPGEQAETVQPHRVDAKSTCHVEELPNEKAAGADPPAGYTRVQIEEDSDSDKEGERGAARPSAGGFHKVVIEEVSDSDSEPGRPSTTVTAADLRASPAQAPPAKPSSPNPSAAEAGFKKVKIEELSDSEEEEEDRSATRAAPKAAAAAAAAAGPQLPVQQAEQELGYSDCGEEQAPPRPLSSPIVSAATPSPTAEQRQPGSSERVWRRVVVQEASDSEEEQGGGTSTVRPAQSSQAPVQATPSWRKLEIAEASGTLAETMCDTPTRMTVAIKNTFISVVEPQSDEPQAHEQRSPQRAHSEPRLPLDPAPPWDPIPTPRSQVKANQDHSPGGGNVTKVRSAPQPLGKRDSTPTSRSLVDANQHGIDGAGYVAEAPLLPLDPASSSDPLPTSGLQVKADQDDSLGAGHSAQASSSSTIATSSSQVKVNQRGSGGTGDVTKAQAAPPCLLSGSSGDPTPAARSQAHQRGSTGAGRVAEAQSAPLHLQSASSNDPVPTLLSPVNAHQRGFGANTDEDLVFRAVQWLHQQGLNAELVEVWKAVKEQDPSLSRERVRRHMESLVRRRRLHLLMDAPGTFRVIPVGTNPRSAIDERAVCYFMRTLVRTIIEHPGIVMQADGLGSRIALARHFARLDPFADAKPGDLCEALRRLEGLGFIDKTPRGSPYGSVYFTSDKWMCPPPPRDSAWQHMRRNVLALLAAGSIPLNGFKQAYLNKHNQPLDHKAFGYNTLSDLLQDDLAEIQMIGRRHMVSRR